jgi:hypothetical protein
VGSFPRAVAWHPINLPADLQKMDEMMEFSGRH